MKYFLSVAISALLFFSSASAQVANWVWARKAGGSNADWAGAVATDASGNVFMTGGFASPTITFGTYTLTNVGGYDVFLVKYDRAGNVLWAKSGGGNKSDTAIGVATDASGDVYICGRFQSDSMSFGSVTLKNGGSGILSNMFLVKFDPSGNALWGKSSDELNNDGASGVCTDHTGNVIVTGTFLGNNIVFGTDTLVNDSTSTSLGGYVNNPSDIFVVKYDALGNQLWAKSLGGKDDDRVFSVTADNSGNIYLTGETETWLSTISFGVPESYALTAMLDANGNTIWVNKSSATYEAVGTSIAIDGSGNAYITGTFIGDTLTFGSVTLQNDSAYISNSMFVVKYNSAGNIVWAKRAGEGWQAVGYGIVCDNVGYLYVNGYFSSPQLVFGADTLIDYVAHTKANMFIAKYDTAGNDLWGIAPSGTGACYSSGITIDDSGALYTCGVYYLAPMNFGPFALPVPDSSDGYLVKLYPPTNTAVKQITVDGKMLVYPVPSNGVVHVALYGEGYTSLSVYDMAGRVVFTHTCRAADKDASVTINADVLLNGAYIVAAIQNGVTITKRMEVTAK